MRVSGVISGIPTSVEVPNIESHTGHTSVVSRRVKFSITCVVFIALLG